MCDRRLNELRTIIMLMDFKQAPRFSPLYDWKQLFLISCFFWETISSHAHGDEHKCLIKAPYVSAHVKAHVAAANMVPPCAPSKAFNIRGRILLHNDAAIGMEQASLRTKTAKQELY